VGYIPTTDLLNAGLWGRHVLVFTGTYEHTIDAKNRLAVPAEIRQLIQDEHPLRPEDSPLRVYVTLGEGQCLCLYTEDGFEKRADELDHSEWEPEQLLAYERLMFSLAKQVELDKQGRVRLPDNLLQMAKLGTEVVLLGVKDHLEIRNRDAWKEHLESILATQPGILMNPRRAMRKGKLL
jgi:MraZ protein